MVCSEIAGLCHVSFVNGIAKHVMLNILLFAIILRIIQLAMDLFTRTPKGYENLRRTLHLPSPKHLQRYKNFVKQTPGINHQNMHWMLLESKRKKLSQEGKEGFIVFDEVQIQVGLRKTHITVINVSNDEAKTAT